MAQLTFGERIHILRRRQGLTQPALAKAVGVSAGTIFRVEKGAFRELSSTTVARLARVLRVRADYLLGLTADDSEWTPDLADEDDPVSPCRGTGQARHGAGAPAA